MQEVPKVEFPSSIFEKTNVEKIFGNELELFEITWKL